MKTTIAIIGSTGNMGSGIARNLASTGHRLLLAASNQTKLSALVAEIRSAAPDADVEALDCARESSWEADIIIPAVPYGAQKEVAARIKDVVTGKILISIVNPLNQAYDGLVTGPATSAAEELADLLPYSKVVKAFNTIFAGDFARPQMQGCTIDGFVAGDDDESVAAVARLVQNAGFNPVVAGKLSMSRVLENMTLLLIGLSIRYNYQGHAGWKVLSPFAVGLDNKNGNQHSITHKHINRRTS